MFGLTKVLTALSALADNLTALSATVAEANAGLRGRLQLAAPDQPQVIDHEPAETNGTRRGKKQQALADVLRQPGPPVALTGHCRGPCRFRGRRGCHFPNSWWAWKASAGTGRPGVA
jgi:hypothetical protein